MSDRTFVALDAKRAGEVVKAAQERVVYCAPGIDESLAIEIVSAHNRLQHDAVTVILDVDPDQFRRGYGAFPGVLRLVEAKIVIRRQRGIRIGFLICDDEGWVFASVPESIELPSSSDAAPNAVRCHPEQIDKLIAAVCPSDDGRASSASPDGNPDVPSGPTESKIPSTLGGDRKPEIGTEVVTKEDVVATKKDLDQRPVKPFDVSRREQVYQSHFEFVELSLENCRVTAKKAQLPRDLLFLVRDKDLNDRIAAQFKLVERSAAASGKAIEAKVNQLRKDNLESLGKKYGSVILVAKKEKFKREAQAVAAEVKAHGRSVVDDLRKDFEKSKQKLIAEMLPGLMAHPPRDLMKGILTDRPTEQDAAAYLDSRLSKIFPDPEKLVKDMELVLLFKAVTWQTLNDPDFHEALRKKFRAVVDRLPYDDHTAVPESVPGQQNQA
jgi:hypothetical protein